MGGGCRPSASTLQVVWQEHINMIKNLISHFGSNCEPLYLIYNNKGVNTTRVIIQVSQGPTNQDKSHVIKYVKRYQVQVWEH